MMKRQIIKINKELCNACSLCVEACHEGAIGIIEGKAVLLRDDYCDGLGNCLPVCPTGAISFEEREAVAFDEDAIAKKMLEEGKTPVNGSKASFPSPAVSQAPAKSPCASGGCPGARAESLRPVVSNEQRPETKSEALISELMQWPVQIKLLPIRAPYFEGADILVAADCAAYAYARFHDTFIKGRITMIGCPKLDEGDYSEKLTEILRQNNIKSVTVVRMEVPCCGGLSNAVVTALKDCGKMIPWQVITLSGRGEIL